MGVQATIEGKDLPELAEDERSLVDGYLNWADKFQPTDLESEVFLSSGSHEYAGTADIICRLDGRLWVVDLKTTRAIKPTHGLQLAAYAQAVYELRGEQPLCGILQLTNDVQRRYRWKPMNEPFEVFLALKRVFDWQRSHEAPRYHFEGTRIVLT